MTMTGRELPLAHDASDGQDSSVPVYMYVGLAKPEVYRVFVFSHAALFTALVADSSIQYANAAGA